MIVQRPAVFSSRPVTSFDRAFDQLTRELFTSSRRQPEFDAAWREGALVLTIDLPGVPASALEISVSDRLLTVAVAEGDGRAAFSRSFQLGASLDPEAISARHVDGRLSITVAETKKAAPRTIAVDTVAPEAIAPVQTPPAIEATEGAPANEATAAERATHPTA